MPAQSESHDRPVEAASESEEHPASADVSQPPSDSCEPSVAAADRWLSHPSGFQKAEQFDRLIEGADPACVIAHLASVHSATPGRIARWIAGSTIVSGRHTTPRVIGTFYHRYANGGVERNLSHLMSLWGDMGYRVVLFTDAEPSDDDYELPAGVERVVLPSGPPASGTTRARLTALRDAVARYAIDVMVYHAWQSPMLLWDLLACKSAGAAFVVHCHGVFSLPMAKSSRYFADMPDIYRLSDGVVALSEVDRQFWSQFNPRTVSVANPLTFDAQTTPRAALGSHTILWIGRLAPEKQPLDAVRILGKVRAEVPDASLLVVGAGDDDVLAAQMHALISRLELDDAVELHGFTKEVLPSYLRSSILLVTSEYEGFMLTLSEAQVVGMPTVMYDLPYMTLVASGGGIDAVEPGDIDAAADAIVRLLRDPTQRTEKAAAARENVRQVAEFDFAGTWQRVFDSASQASGPMPTASREQRIMWDTLLSHYRTGMTRTKRAAQTLERQVEAEQQRATRAEEQLDRIRSSQAYRVARRIVRLPRSVRSLFVRSED